MDSGRLKLLALNISILLCLQVAAPILLVAQTATIHIRVVDGRTGHSLSGMNLAFVDYHTDQKGGQQDDLTGGSPLQPLRMATRTFRIPMLMESSSSTGWVEMGSGRLAPSKNFTIATRGLTEMTISIRFLRS